MENQPPAERGGEDGSIGDRISQLPEPILHHILSLLPQMDAVGTCILSKSWRHLGPTRPKIEFHESYFRGKKQQFLPVLENTLQRYDDQNLSIQEFILGIWYDASNNSCTLLNKWIVNLQMLKRLSLHHVYIEDETFEKVMSSCPLIQHLFLNYCWGLSTIKLNKARNLKHFVYNYRDIDSVEINDDAPSLETIRISSCRKWFHLHNNCLFPRLKSLYLQYVHLPSAELLNNLSSNNCPCLEELELHECYGFREFKLSNRSIKRLVINLSKPNPIEVAIIDAANMLCFEFRSHYYLPSISFATTSREWKSRIEVWCSPDFNAHVLSTWSLKLYELLKALCQSQISLGISNFHKLTNHDSTYGGISEPVVVEHLYLWEYCPSSSLPALLNCVFRICRPRCIELSKVYSQLGESLLVNKEETSQCHFWKQDLEESSIQVSDKNPVQDIRFRLKWRDFY